GGSRQASRRAKSCSGATPSGRAPRGRALPASRSHRRRQRRPAGRRAMRCRSGRRRSSSEAFEHLGRRRASREDAREDAIIKMAADLDDFGNRGGAKSRSSESLRCCPNEQSSGKVGKNPSLFTEFPAYWTSATSIEAEKKKPAKGLASHTGRGICPR